MKIESLLDTQIPANRCICFFAVIMGLAVLSKLISLIGYLDFRLNLTGADLSLGNKSSLYDQLSFLMEVLSYIKIISYLLLIYFFTSWFGKAYLNYLRLSGNEKNRDEASAHWSFFIPILNFWLPYRLLSEINYFHKKKLLELGGSTLNIYSQKSILTWWVFFWLMVLQPFLLMPIGHLGKYYYEYHMVDQLLELALIITCALLAIKMVKQLTIQENQIKEQLKNNSTTSLIKSS